MSIEFTTGSLLEAKTDAIVNTVNCVGVMGKGVALAIKLAYPEVHSHYRRLFKMGHLRIGHITVAFVDEMRSGPIKLVVNFPTKDHWHNPSELEYIRLGLLDLPRVIDYYKIKSIGIPALGCGNGKLNWQEVKPMIIEFAKQMGDKLHCVVYEPRK